MPLKLAYLGVWHSHAVMHVREAAQRPDEFQIVGMYEPEEAVRQQKWLQWTKFVPDIQVFGTPEEVLFSEAEAVIVEGRIHHNLDYTERALRAGKHVLLEKPAGVDLARLEELQGLAEQQGLQLQIAYMWRYNPAIYEMIRLASVGALGDLFYFRGHIPKPKSWHPQIEATLDMYQAGVYFEMAGHMVDLMVAVLGEPVRAQSVLGKHFGNQSQVDNAVVLYEFRSNCTAIVETAAMHVGTDRTRRVELYGTEGTAIHNQIGSGNLSLCLETAREGYETGWQDLDLTAPDDFPSLLRELASCIHGDKQPDYSFTHDLAVQRVLFHGCGIPDGHALKPDGSKPQIRSV